MQVLFSGLHVQLLDLKHRRDACFKLGYWASADALQERCWSIERRIDALEVVA
jgi:hypothetical protein